MKLIMNKPTIELWEAWVDLQCTDETSNGTLFVWGELCVGSSLTDPLLIKRKVQGGKPTDLYLEVVPYIIKNGGRITETRYSEPLQNVMQYTRIFICAGEEVLAEIRDIELLD